MDFLAYGGSLKISSLPGEELDLFRYAKRGNECIIFNFNVISIRKRAPLRFRP